MILKHEGKVKTENITVCQWQVDGIQYRILSKLAHATDKIKIEDATVSY